MSAHNYAALFEHIQPGWTLLEVGDPIPGLAEQVKQAVPAAIGSLPDALAAFDLITCRNALRTVPDAFTPLSDCARLLKRGGWLWIEDLLVPDRSADAHYLNAFYRFQAAAAMRFYAEYEWRGLLLDAGFTIESIEVVEEICNVARWTQECSPYVRERLEILLRQAPDRVRDWLLAQAVGTPEANFQQTIIRILTQKSA